MTHPASTPATTPVASHAPPPGKRRGPAGRVGPVAWALAASLVVAGFVGLLLVRPGLNPFLAVDGALARAWVSGPALTIALLVVAVLGAVVAALALRRRGSLSAAVVVTAVVEVVVLGVLVQGTGTLSTFGYLVGLVVPVLLPVLAVQVFRSRPGARIPVALVSVAAVVGVIIGRDVLVSYVEVMGPALVREAWSLLTVLVTMATAVVWAAVLVAGSVRSGALRNATAWVTRHRRLFTVLAALGPLPYGVARLSWLTPWPMLTAGNDVLTAATRLQGIMLSSGAWVGFALTLGLIARWGEVFPRWFPRRAGQPVPPLFAIIPGGGVALMLCGSAIPLLQLLGLQGMLIFPAWLWGPALALAVWGYAGHRSMDGPPTTRPRSAGPQG